MKIIPAIILCFFISLSIYSQSRTTDTTGLKHNCLNYFTKREICKFNVTIQKIDLDDTLYYTELPTLNELISEINYRFNYPNIAFKAGVRGIIICHAYVDTNGKVVKTEIIKGIGAGCDEDVERVIKELSFIPAKVQNRKVESVFKFFIDYSFDINIDESKEDIEQIEIFYWSLRSNYIDSTIFHKNNKAERFYRLDNPEVEIFKGEIDTYTYKRLCDFIISQHFLEMEDYYFSDYVDGWTVTIRIKIDDKYKSVLVHCGFGPVSIWAIDNVIKHIISQIDWRKDF